MKSGTSSRTRARISASRSAGKRCPSAARSSSAAAGRPTSPSPPSFARTCGSPRRPPCRTRSRGRTSSSTSPPATRRRARRNTADCSCGRSPPRRCPATSMRTRATANRPPTWSFPGTTSSAKTAKYSPRARSFPTTSSSRRSTCAASPMSAAASIPSMTPPICRGMKNFPLRRGRRGRRSPAPYPACPSSLRKAARWTVARNSSSPCRRRGLKSASNTRGRRRPCSASRAGWTARSRCSSARAPSTRSAGTARGSSR